MTASGKWFALVMVLVVLTIVYLLGPVLIPFVISFLLAYFLNPLVVRLARCKIPRVVSACLVFIIAVIIILAILFSLIPSLERQVISFIHNLPNMLNWVQDTVVPWLDKKYNLSITLPNIKANIIQHLNNNGSNLAKVAFQTAFNSGYMAVEVILNLVMIPVVTLYLLIDWSKVTTQGKALLPFSSERRDIVANLIKECGDMLAGFLRGQLLVMIALGIVYSIGLTIVGVELALLIGVIAGLLSIVPYLGFFTGLIIALIATAIQFHTWLHILGVLLVFAIGVVCENFVFSPLFVGDRIGLHPVAVIFAVLAGGKLFGFVGVLLALPVAAIVMVLFRHWHRYYFEQSEIEEEREGKA